MIQIVGETFLRNRSKSTKSELAREPPQPDFWRDIPQEPQQSTNPVSPNAWGAIPQNPKRDNPVKDAEPSAELAREPPQPDFW